MSSWKKYGGTNSAPPVDIKVNGIVTNYFTVLQGITNDIDICGNMVIAKRLDVYGDVSFNKNVTVVGKFSLDQDLDVTKNLTVGQNAIISGTVTINNYLYFKGKSGAYLFGDDKGFSINKEDPEAILDICGNNTYGLNIQSSLTNNKNILARNVSGQGIILSVDPSNSKISFFHDTSINIQNMNGENPKSPDAYIQYLNGGTLQLQASDHTQIINPIIITDNSKNNIDYGSVTIYNSNTSRYLYDIYHDSSCNTSTNIVTMAIDNSSTSFMHLVTPNLTGGAIGGGTYPLDTSKNMITIGTVGVDANYESIYKPNQTIVSGSNNMKLKNTLGINTTNPRIDAYSVDINGPLHIESNEITTSLFTPTMQIIKMKFFKQNTNIGVAVGTPYNVTFGVNRYSSVKIRVFFTRDGGSIWIRSPDVENDSNSSFSINDIYIHDEQYALVYGQNCYGYYLDMSSNRVVPFCLSLDSLPGDTKDIVSITGVDFSGNSSGNILTKLFFVIKQTQTNDQASITTKYVLFSCNAAFGNNTNYYDSYISGSRESVESLIKNGLFLFNSSGDPKVDQIIAGSTTGDNGPFNIVSSNNIKIQEVSGNVVDVAPNGTTGYIYIAGGDSTNNQVKPSIRKYNYSGPSNINEVTDCSWNAQRFSSLQPPYSFNAMGVYDLSTVIVVGNSIITYTKNGGSTWTNINDDIVNGKILNSVSIYDLSNAIVVGNHGTMLYTTDGYITWKNVPSHFLKLSTSGYPLKDASFNNVSMLSKSEFVVSNVISTYESSQSGTTGSVSYGSSKIIYNYVPALFNNENNNVIDICGNMNIYGNIFIDQTSGNISSNSNNFQLLSNSKNIYVGISSELISIGNKNRGNISINNSTHILQDLSVNRGVTVFSGNVDIMGKDSFGGYLNARGIFLDSLNTGFVYLNGGNPETRFTPQQSDASYALYIGGYRPAVRIDGSFCVNGDTVYSGNAYFGNSIISNVNYDQSAIWVKSGNAQFDGSNVTITKGKINILSDLSTNGITYIANEGALSIPNGDINVGGNMVINRRLSLLANYTSAINKGPENVLYIDYGDILCDNGGSFISQGSGKNYITSVDCSAITLEYHNNDTNRKYNIVKFTPKNIIYSDNDKSDVKSDWSDIANGNVNIHDIGQHVSTTYSLIFSGKNIVDVNSVINGPQQLQTNRYITYNNFGLELSDYEQNKVSIGPEGFTVDGTTTVYWNSIATIVNNSDPVASIPQPVASIIPQHSDAIHANYNVLRPFTYYYGNPQSRSLLSDISATLTLSGGWGSNVYKPGDWISVTNISGSDTFYKINATYGTYTPSNPKQIGNIAGNTFLSGYGSSAKFVWTDIENGWIAVT